ncbi:MAG: ribonuclease PH, partial [Nitrospira sp.]|nr:ribonuclease PH [Nitrospira sp.]
LMDAIRFAKKNGLIKEIPVRDYLAAVSVGILEEEPFLDLNYAEDSTAEVDMNIIMTGKGKFVEVQGTAEGAPFSKTQMEGLISLEKHGIEELIAIQHKLIGDLV